MVDEHLGRTESVRPEELAALTKADRCDNGRCSAAAVVRVLIPYTEGSGQLDFCDHHYRQHQEPLVEIAGAIRDERHLLEAR
jgi:hypothetical protein